MNIQFNPLRLLLDNLWSTIVVSTVNIHEHVYVAYQDNTVDYNTAPLSCSPHYIVVFDSVFLCHTASNTRTKPSSQLQYQL